MLEEKAASRSKEFVTVKDLAAYHGCPGENEDVGEFWPAEELVAPPQRFVTIGAAQPTLVQPEMSARIHHQRDREKGRAWKERNGRAHGAIFAFESIDAGQSFEGLIQVRGDSEIECGQVERRVRELLGKSILVGRSRRAGYGGMAGIHWQASREREIAGSGKAGLKPVNWDVAANCTFRLLLTSACIVRDPVTGQIDPGYLEFLLRDILGNRAELVRKRWTFEAIGGFNRKWKLETPQVLAVGAGSVLVLVARERIPLRVLCDMEDQGMGERREEGYGRLVFLDEPIKCLSLHLPGRPAPSPVASCEPSSLVFFIQRRIIDANIRQRIQEKAAEIAGSATGLPTNSLIGRLRSPLRGDPHEAIETLQRWLGEDNEKERLKRPALDQLDQCKVRMNGTHSSLKEWLGHATQDQEKEEDRAQRPRVLKWLKADVIAQRCHIVSKESVNETLKAKAKEISVGLIDAVLAAMAIRNKQEEGTDGK
jgi:CRISPR-associated protein Csx10